MLSSSTTSSGVWLSVKSENPAMSEKKSVTLSNDSATTGSPRVRVFTTSLSQRHSQIQTALVYDWSGLPLMDYVYIYNREIISGFAYRGSIFKSRNSVLLFSILRSTDRSRTIFSRSIMFFSSSWTMLSTTFVHLKSTIKVCLVEIEVSRLFLE